MCDTLCLVGPDGTLFAKASDRPPGEVQVLERHPRRIGGSGAVVATQYLTIDDPGAAALVGSRPDWLWGFEHGVNEHRVAIGNERVRTARDAAADPEGLIGMDLVRLALERASTAAAGVEVIGGLLARHGQGGAAQSPGGEAYYSSFLVADPTEAFVVETAGDEWVARPAGARCAISNRLELAEQWADPSAPTGHADLRLAATRAAVAGVGDVGPDAAADLVAALRHHGRRAGGAPGRPSAVDPVPAVDDPVLGGDDRSTVCMHARGRVATTAAMVCWLPRDLDRPVRSWVALGSPCASVFVPFEGDDVPAWLSSATTWSRFARLARRAEEDPAALAEIRAVLDPVEGALWDAADAPRQAVVAPARPLGQHAHAGWPSVDAALERLGV